jgi:hypothetical protein
MLDWEECIFARTASNLKVATTDYCTQTEEYGREDIPPAARIDVYIFLQHL